jgi:hypothetical protein
MIEWLGRHAAALGVVGASLTFMWSAIQFMLVHKQHQRAREFDSFHRLIKLLVEPEEGLESTRIDRQVAIVFELRHFPRYFEVTRRILAGLRDTWSKHEGETARLVREIDFTLSYIDRHRHGMRSLLSPKQGIRRVSNP